MNIIKVISKNIEDELDDAEKYVKQAIVEKEKNPSVAELFHTLAREEMGHMDRLHTAVVKLIKEYRDANGDPPEGMQLLYEYLHEAHTERAARIQAYIMQYTNK